MTLTYSITRQQAADFLGVSTRTVDRYVKKWTLSYKKVANKVILAQAELDVIKADLDLLNQPAAQVTRERVAAKAWKTNNTGIVDPAAVWSTWGIAEFAAILTQKDQTIEEKNQLIYLLQRKIGEVETQMMNMVALPHHTEEKESLQTQISELEDQADNLKAAIRKEKIRNAIFVGMIIIAAFVLLLWVY